MLNEFYEYVANRLISFFQKRASRIRPGERYCLRLDTPDMVEGVDAALQKCTDTYNIQGTYDMVEEVDAALRKRTAAYNIQGTYDMVEEVDAALRKRTATNKIQGTDQYRTVYHTFTIKLRDGVELVVASKIKKMTDDFLATLRNAKLTDKQFPILMITHSPIDTITSGTADLSAKGMPFHVTSIIDEIKTGIKSAGLSIADRALLEVELDRKRGDRFSDKSSLFEYSDILTVLGRGHVEKSDFTAFCLLYDDQLQKYSEGEIRNRIYENHSIFEQIDHVFKYGNIAEDLEGEYEQSFIGRLQSAKRNNGPWYEGCTFDEVKKARDKHKKKLENPLIIEDKNIEAFSESAPVPRELMFIRSDGESKAKQRYKNIIIFNPESKQTVTVSISCNTAVNAAVYGASVLKNSRGSRVEVVKIEIKSTGCVFALAEIADKNNEKITYRFRICVLNLPKKYLESILTRYALDVRKSLKNSSIRVLGVQNELLINPEQKKDSEPLQQGKEYICSYDETLRLQVPEEFDTDSGELAFDIKCGDITIPMKIVNEDAKPVELTGAGAFRQKYAEKKGFEYSDGKIKGGGTKEYYAKSPFKESLEYENLFVTKGWLAATESISGIDGRELDIPEPVRKAYQELIDELRKSHQLPSLSYYSGELLNKAEAYVEAVEAALSAIPPGVTLAKSQNDILLLGCVIRTTEEQLISMSPLHPLNVLYQLSLLKEENVGEVSDNLVEKLSCLYLLPYIKDPAKKLYHAIEQRHSPEWRIYAPLSNKRYQGARNFVQRLVRDKIEQYESHFSFLFKDLGNDLFCINLVNMGDCREVLQGLMLFYSKAIKADDTPAEDPDTPTGGHMRFDINIYNQNIYNQPGEYNDFSVLSDPVKLREYIETYGKDVEDAGEMALVLSRNVHYYYRDPEEETYQYAHLTFYEMESSEEAVASRMDSITTGAALGGLVSGTPSVLDAGWYKTGFGTRFAKKTRLMKLAEYYNAMFRVAFTGSSYEEGSSIFTEIASSVEGKLEKIYDASNWVVFVDPKVDLSFFKKSGQSEKDLMIIHYSDQYTSASGYDDITVTRKSEQYEEIIQEQLNKHVHPEKQNVRDIISLFNAVNGGWMLRLISEKEDSNFSREKMSILSAVKLCMAYYAHPGIVWIPISLEEILRVSGGAGYSKNNGLLSAKNLGFDKGVTSDDILMVGIEGPKDRIRIYLHPVEVKIGQNLTGVISKAKEQVLATYNGLWNALWPGQDDQDRNSLKNKLERNFFMQMVIVCCEKMRLYEVYPVYEVYPGEQWELITADFREALLNDGYSFSRELDPLLGKGTVISFKKDAPSISGTMEDDVCILEFPEETGYEYLIKPAKDIESELDGCREDLPGRLKSIYTPDAGSATPVAFAAPRPAALPAPAPESEITQNKTVDAAAPAEEKQPTSPAGAGSDGRVDPPRRTMQVVFGTDIKTGGEILWRPNDTDQVFHTNTGIIGTMGTGKTQFTKSLITQLYHEQKYNFDSQPLGILIFDYKGEYNKASDAHFVSATGAKVFTPYHLPFNPLALTKPPSFKPLLPIHTANAFKDTLSKVYGLGVKQQNTLFMCIKKAYEERGIKADDPQTWDNVPPTFDDVYRIYSDDDDIKKGDSLAAAMEKLSQFQVFEKDPVKTRSLFDMLNGVVVIDLSRHDADIQSLIVAITLDLFYAQMLASGSSKMDRQYRQLTKIILVDEADNFMSEGFPSLKKILKEGREFGVGMILSTQFLEHFGSAEDDFSKYILTWVVHNVADLKMSDVEFVFKTEPKSEKTQMLFRDIKSLKKHRSIVKIGTSEPKYMEDKAFWELYQQL